MRESRPEPNQFLDLAVIKTCFLSTDFSMLLISLAGCASSLVISWEQQSWGYLPLGAWRCVLEGVRGAVWTGRQGEGGSGRWRTTNPAPPPMPALLSFPFWLMSWLFNLLVFFPPYPPYGHTGLLWDSARGKQRAKLILFLVGNR